MKAAQRKKKPESYQKRTYRAQLDPGGLVSTMVRVQETDLQILASTDITDRARELILEARLQLENYIVKHPLFSATLDPLPMDLLAPPMVRRLLQAGLQAGVGPMAAVAGTIAEYVGEGLLADGEPEIMVENGGDIYLARQQSCDVAIFAGRSSLSNKVGLRINARQMPLGICTSSGTVGHSLSLGEADSVTVLARSAALADAAATRLGNEVGKGDDEKSAVTKALEQAKTIDGLLGVVVICGEAMGAIGDVELIRVAV
ncbi:UPF0280 family protein [Methanococcoides sp. SA1]|uniref:UPF0280 family protein n=1 Tax=Candidatus Desulfatifera sulfidica TaxID=2841691 RepID=A0A8J6N8F4_9BACT|nr:UPF0280 family protein [Candidatus Desulfatifera sulfidica]NPE29460.1 UPF0280 family protein [Methanococcoides sp. SA1]